MKKEALLLVGSIPPEGGDNAIENHLDALGYQVTVREGASAEDYHVNGKDVVIISSTAASDKTEESHHSVSQRLRWVKAPIIVLGGDLFDDMGMTESNGDLSETGNRTEVRIVHPGHPMAAGLSGDVIISEKKATRVTGKPNKKAIKVAVLTSRPSRVAIFAYKSGASMPGLIAPARRVGFLFSHEIAATATAQGWALFNAAVKWAVCAKEFDEIFRDEWEEIKDRRKEHYRSDQGVGENRPPNNLVGLALSGGGIRSATFSLGVLQGMHKLKLVRIFDYLSTVSGGGYLGGWWSAWLARDGLNAQNKGIAPRLTVDDLKNPTSLRQKLSSQQDPQQDPLSTYLREELLNLGWSSDTRDLAGEPPPAKASAKALVDALNQLIEGSSLYDDEAFEKVSLTDETRDLLEQELQGKNLVRLNRLLLEEAYPDEIYRGLFPAHEGLEPERMGKYITRQDTQKVAEGSLSAGSDPVHHLRLFAHYLMPRSGFLSGDRWRAVASLSRNFLLTWLVLLPILLEVVLLGQLYFVLQNGSPENFFHNCWSRIEQKEKDEKKAALALAAFRATRCADCEPEPPIQQTQREAGSGAPGSEKPLKEVELEQALKQSISELNTERAALTGKLQERTMQVLWVLLPIAGWIVLMIVVWLRSNITKHPVIDWVAHTLGGIGALVVIACVLTLYDVGVWTRLWALLRQWQEHVGLTVAVLVWLAIAVGLWLYTWPWGVKEWEWRKEVRKNKNIRVNAVLLVAFVIVASLLVLSGFGHEAANYLWNDPRPQKAAVDYVAKAGGWAALAMAVFGSIFTMFKTSPTGGEDKNRAAGTRGMTLAILQITPPLVMIVLMVVLAWAGHGILDHVQSLQEADRGSAWPLFVAAFAGLSLCFFFAIFEMRKWRRSHRVLGWFSVFLLVSAALGTGAYFWMLATSKREVRYFFLSPVFWSLAVATATGLIVLLRFTLLKGKTAIDGPTASARESAREEGRAARRNLIENLRVAHPFWIVIGAFVLAIPVAFLTYGLLPDVSRGFAMKLTSAALGGIFFCLAIAILEMLVGEDDSLRSKLLVLSAYLILVGFLLVSFYFNPAEPIEHRSVMIGFAALEVLALVLTWVVAFGWMADPNALSMHLFYKSRLVRAYLGASNLNRSYQEITEAVAGDDMLLSTLKNCERGGPYHLINTTLNLVGGRDLSTSQRSSAYFVLSKRYCGSSRTGYRPTDQYMDGRFTLGTAVAVSGAAISPNMGAKNQTAALAMLMTLLNVRLGYWAPTPNQGSWPSPQARLWPFYMLREFLSQTTDLSSYCYLTDGGHFDNTGLYSLVERGCRYIVLVDAGADPNTCFEDLGDAIRRCRIDFGAEIELKLGPLFKKLDDDSNDYLSAKHYVVGSIKYSAEHLEQLNWTEYEKELDRKGVIILIKPSLVAVDSSDVRQYHRQNSVFPQQSTLDQWFDEAQFESYRRLGEHCAKVVFGGAGDGGAGDFDILKDLAPDTVKKAFEAAIDKEEQASDKAKHSGETGMRHGSGPPPNQEPGEEPAPEQR